MMQRQRRAVVVGAGVIGATSAEMLMRTGHDVTIIDTETAPAQGASHGNAGQLCYPFAVALGSPGFLRGMPRSLLDPDSGIGVSPWTVIKYWGWLVGFLRNCTDERYRRNSERLLELAKLSALAHERLLERHDVAFDARQTGKLWLAPTNAALTTAASSLPLRRTAGFTIEVLSEGDCRKVAPQLENARYKIAGGIYAPDSPVGDCQAFTSGLICRLRAQGLKVKFGVKVLNVRTSAGCVTGLQTTRGEVPADLVVLATGLGAPDLIPRSWRPAIAPLRGISVTLPAVQTALEVSVTDPKRAVAICRLGSRLRVTGGAEFAPPGRPTERAVSRIINVARNWLPDAANYDAVENRAWCGARPTTADSFPCIAQVGAKGLYVNSGHGSLGWTLAAGSAELLRQQIM